MKLLNHRLVPEQGDVSVQFIPSPNKGGIIVPQYLIIHYTAGSDVGNSISLFQEPESKVSAHLVIAMDGAITQMVPFDQEAWHAGDSRWKDLTGLNQYSIGIELDNPGKLAREESQWRSHHGEVYKDEMVMQAVHKHQTEMAGWHIYTAKQLKSCIEVSRLLVQKYKLQDILGHDDIAPNRKEDPGPAFPMEVFKSSVMDRRNYYTS